MLKDIELFILLFVAFVAILVIFNARWIIKNKVKKTIENRIVQINKLIAFIVLVVSFLLIYFIK